MPKKGARTELFQNPTTINKALTKAQQYDAAQKTQGPQEVTVTLEKFFRCDKTTHKQENCWTHCSACPTCEKTGRPHQKQMEGQAAKLHGSKNKAKQT